MVNMDLYVYGLALFDSIPKRMWGRWHNGRSMEASKHPCEMVGLSLEQNEITFQVFFLPVDMLAWLKRQGP